MKAVAKKACISVILTLFGGCLYAQCLFINEFYPRPASAGTNGNICNTGEWIELYNASPSPLNISCYTLCMFENQTGTERGHTFIFPTGSVIPAHGFFLIGGNGSICPTCDFTTGALNLNWHSYNCASGRIAGYNQACGNCSGTSRMQYLGVLQDSGEDIVLFDAAGNLMDAVTFGGAARGNRSVSTVVSIPLNGSCSAHSQILPRSTSSAFEYVGPASAAGIGFKRTQNGGSVWTSYTLRSAASPGASNGTNVPCGPLAQIIESFSEEASGAFNVLKFSLNPSRSPARVQLSLSYDGLGFELLKEWTDVQEGTYTRKAESAETFFRLEVQEPDGTLASELLAVAGRPMAAGIRIGQTEHSIIVNVESDTEPFFVRMVNLNGETLNALRSQAGDASLQLETGGYAPGLYIVEVRSGKGEICRRKVLLTD